MTTEAPFMHHDSSSGHSMPEPLTPPPDAFSDPEDHADQQSALLAQEIDARRPVDQLDPKNNDSTSVVSSDNDEVEELTTTTTTTTTAPARLRKGSKDYDGLTAHHRRLHQRHRSVSEDDHLADNEITDSTNTTTTSHASTLKRSSGTAFITSPITSADLHEPTAGAVVSPFHADAKKKGNNIHSIATTAGPTEPVTEVAGVVSTEGSASSRSSTASPGTPPLPAEERYHTILTTTTTTTTRKRKVRRPTFEARPSRLDPETMTKNQDPFRGFHTLFWIVMGAYGLITFNEEWTRVGKLFGGTLFSSFSQDAIFLAFSDFCLVSSTFIAYFLAKLVAKDFIPYQPVGFILQHIVQVIFLISAVAWTIWRDWPWVQSGFFTLHAISMLMKIHSYISTNGECSIKLADLKQLEDVYGTLKKIDAEMPDDVSQDPTLDASDDDEQNRHRTSAAAATILHNDQVNKNVEVENDETAEPMVTTEMLAAEIGELRKELTTSTGELWPANVTVANFLDYLIVPSLIYELQYPRTEKIRLAYIFEKAVATLGTFTLLYLTTEHYIYPVIFDPTISPLRALVLLLIPFMMNYLMIFYIIFECICNAFAELSCFADRNFYEDWWNCVSFDEWARKWNKPVHNFLLRHVYTSSIESLHLSKSNAAFITFFLSSCVHELVMMVVTRKVRMYLFFLQMFQLPLIWMGNRKAIRAQPRLANAFFWMGMFCGPPLLGVAYCYA